MIIEMELSAIGMIIFIIIIRTFFAELFPRKTFIVLWYLVAGRLLIPYTIPFHFNVYSLIYIFFDNNNNLLINSNYDIRIWSILQENKKVLLIVWAIGSFLVATKILFTHLQCKQIYKTALPINSRFIEEWKREYKLWRKINILQLDRIDSPFTYGFFKPIIVLPKSITKLKNEQLKYVLLHEYMHIKHFDIVFKWILVICISLHWFNPFVWVLYIYANRDIELNCDEYVLNKIDISHKAEYALTLISLEEMKNGMILLCNQFCKKASEERIEAIMKKRKVAKKERILATFIVCVIMLGFGTSVSAKNEVIYDIESNMEIDLSIPTVTIRENEKDGSFSAIVKDQNNKVIYAENGINLDSQATIEYVYEKIFN